MIDISAEDYIKGMQAEVASRKSKNKKPTRLNQPGQVGIFHTKPFRVISGAKFEVTDVGNPDASLTGTRPKRPDQIIQDTKEDKEKEALR